MITRHLVFISSWIYFTQGAPGRFQTVQFLQPATSFATRTDQFVTGSRIPKTSRRHIGIDDFFSSNLSPIHTNLNSWDRKPGFFQYSSMNVDRHFNSHFTPDFSNGLAYPDPYLRTGREAKSLASYLYSKELFFHNVPHVKALLRNQEERRENNLTPHELGSLRPRSPWYRYKGIEGFGEVNNVFRF